LVSDNLVNNIQILIWNEAKPILGWDIKIESNKILDDNQLSYIDNLVNEDKIIVSKKVQTYTTIVDKYDNPSLVSLIFVDDKFPLYWEFTTNENSDNSWIVISHNVADLFVVDWKIEVYWKKYDVWGIIDKFPDSWLNFYDDGKKIVLDLWEFDILKLDELWARIDREYLIKVINPEEFDNILSELKESKIFEWIRIRDYKRWWDRFADTFWELDKFIKYILIVSFILTILIIFLSVESFYIWNKRQFSILKILGMDNNRLILFNLLLFIIIFIICLFVSVLLSEFIFYFVRQFELSSTFHIDNLSIIKTGILWIVILWVSITLPLLKFFSNNPLAWLKENFLQVYSKKEVLLETILVIIWNIFIYNLLIWDFIWSIYFTFILFFWVLLLWIFLNFLLTICYKKAKNVKKINFSIFDSIRNTVKPWNLSLLIIFGFIISFASLFFISTISLNFLEKLNIDLNNENNIYVINLTDKDIKKIDKKYRKQAYSTILWRILTINNVDIREHIAWWQPENLEERRGWWWRFTREFNITDNSLEDIKILKWNKIKKWEVSVDDDFSKSLKVNIWDKIEFFIYGIKKTLIVANIRESQAGSINPFFYFQVHPDDFKSFPKTYFLSAFPPLDNIKNFKNDFLSKTGNYISFIEIDKVVKEIKSISGKILIIIQILFTYIFIFCTISLIISIIFLIPFKEKKSKLYNILWANNKFIKINNLFEYYYLQSIAFVFSIIISSSLSYYILSLSDFIEYSWSSYLLSLLILIIIFVLLLFVIKFLMKNVNKK